MYSHTTFIIDNAKGYLYSRRVYSRTDDRQIWHPQTSSHHRHASKLMVELACFTTAYRRNRGVFEFGPEQHS